MSLAGVDVSLYQRDVDWQAVEVPGHELVFAYAQATDGTTITDANFARNWEGMGHRGLMRGAYHFAEPPGYEIARGLRAAAIGEAEHFLAVLHSVGGLRPGDLPPALDIEKQPPGLSPEEMFAWIGYWVDHVREATKRQPVIYTYPSWWTQCVGRVPHAHGCPLWISNTGTSRPAVPPPWKGYTFWQYETGVPLRGIIHPPGGDVSVFNGSLAELQRFVHGVHAPKWPGHELHHGMSGAAVRTWKEALRQHRGFTHLHPNDHFDDETAEACRWLQLYLGAEATERVDEALWNETWTHP